MSRFPKIATLQKVIQSSEHQMNTRGKGDSIVNMVAIGLAAGLFTGVPLYLHKFANRIDKGEPPQ